jgi:hypothetical protein
MTTTQSGVAAPNFAAEFNEDDAAEAFLSRWNEEDPEEVSEAPTDDEEAETVDEADEAEDADEGVENDDESEEDPQDEAEDDSETDEDDEDKASDKEASDDVIVKVKEGDKVHEVSIKDLKRLYGQEAALTKKSQQVADDRKAVEANGQKLAAQLQRVYDKVSARWEPYSKIDMLVASKQLDAESFTALRQEAQAAYDDFRFITQEVDTFVADASAARQKAIQDAGAKAVETLKTAIPGWNTALYDSIREFAVERGMDKKVVDELVDPVAIQMLHDAMQFRKAKTIATKKIVKQPKKVLKTTKAAQAKDVKSNKADAAMRKLKSSGSVEDATNAFMARWAD